MTALRAGAIGWVCRLDLKDPPALDQPTLQQALALKLHTMGLSHLHARRNEWHAPCACTSCWPMGHTAASCPLAPQRLIVRSAYVCFTAILGCVLPFFGSIVSLGRDQAGWAG